MVLEGVLETFGLHRAARAHLRASLTLRSTLRSHRGLQKGSVWSSISATPRGDAGTETGRGCYLRWTDPRKRIGPTSCEVSLPVSHSGFGRYVSQPHPSGLALGLSQRSELLGLVVSSTMGSEQRAVKGHLDGVADQAEPDGLSSITVADAIAGAGEADRSVFVDDAQDL